MSETVKNEMNEASEIENSARNIKLLIIGIVLAVGLIYFFSNPKPQNYYDYTFRVADNMLRGQIAFKEKPPSWLNEFVPFEGSWYSVFPLGGVVSMMPFAVFKVFGFIKDMPAALISALSASFIALFLFLIARRYDYGSGKRILLSMAILFGTWMWANETMAGAWQLALGFAVLGEVGAIYFTIFNRKPFLAGIFFALGFGNRTEILLTAPIFMFLLFYNFKSQTSSLESAAEISDVAQDTVHKKKKKHQKKANSSGAKQDKQSIFQTLKSEISNVKNEIFSNPQSAIRVLASFCAVPFALGLLTLIYNYVRFHSFTDFGYARIPGVLDEPWYNHGIFSYHYIPGQAREMLWKPWETKDAFPYLLPNGFSSSILWSSPFVLLTLRFGARDKILKYLAWLAIFLMTILLWMHGNSGGWQFGYRYAMVLLPFVFLILLENSPRKITPLEWAAYGFSFVINAYAVYLFHWSGYMKV
ncbi:MAG TPA: hypothetical protein VGC76_03395 [Pyrinomonadaceae bacterium]|jgi:hypothetical protein